MPTLKTRVNITPDTELWIRLRAIPGRDATNCARILEAAIRLVDEQLRRVPHAQRTPLERALVRAAKAEGYQHPLSAVLQNGKHDHDDEGWF